MLLLLLLLRLLSLLTRFDEDADGASLGPGPLPLEDPPVPPPAVATMEEAPAAHDAAQHPVGGAEPDDGVQYALGRLVPRRPQLPPGARYVTPFPGLGRLYRLLQQLDRERRHEVLAKRFSQDQRLILERWIMCQRQCGCNHAPLASSMDPAVPLAVAITGKDPGGRVGRRRKQTCTRELATADPWRKRRVSLSSVPVSFDATVKESASRARGVVVHHRRGRILYSAVVLFERLELRTREVADLAVATRFRDALLAAKTRLSVEPWTRTEGYHDSASLSSDATVDLICKVVPALLLATLQQYGLDHSRDLGLYLRACTPARQWIGATLWGPVFRLDRGLDVGLRGWQLMRAARGSGPPITAKEMDETWAKTRQAHMDVWASAGRNRTEVMLCLSRLEERSAKRRELRLAAVNARQMAATARQLALTAAATRRFVVAGSRVEIQISKLLDVWAASLARESALRKASELRCVGPQTPVALRRTCCRLLVPTTRNGQLNRFVRQRPRSRRKARCSAHT